LSCPISREWIVLCSENFSTEEEIKYKEEYWAKYKNKLKENGFDNDTTVVLSSYEKEIIQDLDGALLLFKIGTSKAPATDKILNEFAKVVEQMDLDNCKVLVVPHNVELQKVHLPALKKLENKILSEKKEQESFVIDMDELL